MRDTAHGAFTSPSYSPVKFPILYEKENSLFLILHNSIRLLSMWRGFSGFEMVCEIPHMVRLLLRAIQLLISVY